MSKGAQAAKSAGKAAVKATKSAIGKAIKKKRNKKLWAIFGGVSSVLILGLLLVAVVAVAGIVMMFQTQSAIAGHYQSLKGDITTVQTEWEDIVIAEMNAQGVNVEYSDLVLCIIAAASGGEGEDIMMSSVYDENPGDVYPRGELTIKDPLYSIQIGVARFKTMLHRAFSDAVPDLSSTYTDQSAYNKLWVTTAGYWYVGYIDKYDLWTIDYEKEFVDLLPPESMYRRESFVTDVQNLFMILHPETGELTEVRFPYLDGDFYINSNYGKRVKPDDDSGEVEFHTGIDIAAPAGTAVFAAEDGVVSIPPFNGDGFGNHIKIDHGGGFTTMYCHLSSIAVTEGQRVSKGDTIGGVGRTGRSTGNHLHFETRYNGVPRNPMEYILWGRAAE
jgi:Membrane proteins related to metalloendopeptidases